MSVLAPTGMPASVRPLPFSDDAIKSAVDDALSTVPDAKVAFVAHAEVEGVEIRGKAAVMVRLDKGWSFAGYVEASNKKPVKAGAEIRFAR